jgi:hypothetical protein
MRRPKNGGWLCNHILVDGDQLNQPVDPKVSGGKVSIEAGIGRYQELNG